MRTRYLASVLLIALFVGTAAVLVFLPPATTLLEPVAAMGWFGYLLYVLLLATAVVCAPVTVVPLIPLASQLFGPFTTGVLSVLGWTLGSAIAFLLARHAARPVLLRFVRFDRVEALAEKVTPRTQFWGIVLLRHLVPVDVLSYALGLIPSVSFPTYLAATVVGVTWFSFAFAYVGDALVTQNVYLLVTIGGASLAVFVIGWYLLRRT